MTLKISFLIPPDYTKDGHLAERVFGCTFEIYPIPNIFVLTLAQMLINKGNSVSIKDLSKKRISKDEMGSFIQEDDSDIYIFYTVNLSIEADLEAIEAIRKHKEFTPIILLGPAVTIDPGKFILAPNTYVCRGEFEYTVIELIDRLGEKDKDLGADLKSIDGLSFLNDGIVVNNRSRPLIENLDELPFPARNLIERDAYYSPKFGVSPITAILTSRGCPYPCTFCVPNSLSFATQIESEKYFHKKPAVRMRSPESVIEEFQLLKSQGYKAVTILDDQFIWGEERTKKITDGIKDLGIKWGCLARADRITEPIAKAMSEANCVFIDIGVESFDENILLDIKKQINTDQIKNAVKILKKYGIMPKLNIMFGSSILESKKTIELSVKEAEKLNPGGIMYGICNPIPGTKFHDVVSEGGMLISDSYTPVDSQKSALVNLPNISANELEKMLRWANYRFYLSPKFILSNIGRIRNPKELISALKSLYKKLF